MFLEMNNTSKKTEKHIYSNFLLQCNKINSYFEVLLQISCAMMITKFQMAMAAYSLTSIMGWKKC